jgi:hypothetical protein
MIASLQLPWMRKCSGVLQSRQTRFWRVKRIRLRPTMS